MGVVRCCPVLDAVAGLAGAREVEVRKREGAKRGVLGASACLLDSRTEKESCSQTQRIATRRGAISVGGEGGLSLVASGWR